MQIPARINRKYFSILDLNFTSILYCSFSLENTTLQVKLKTCLFPHLLYPAATPVLNLMYNPSHLSFYCLHIQLSITHICLNLILFKSLGEWQPLINDYINPCVHKQFQFILLKCYIYHIQSCEYTIDYPFPFIFLLKNYYK